jgi:mannose-6-phosphate isomerase-like protein (cupin superfamily)
MQPNRDPARTNNTNGRRPNRDCASAAHQGGNIKSEFMTKHLPMAPDAVAPDGSDVRLLLGLDGGGMAHFELAPGETSTAITHRTVEEIWFFLSGRGKMWRKQGDRSDTVDVYSGVSLSIPVGTHFQFRSFGYEPLAAIGVTMPPWPGEEEAVAVVGEWEPTVPR